MDYFFLNPDYLKNQKQTVEATRIRLYLKNIKMKIWSDNLIRSVTIGEEGRRPGLGDVFQSVLLYRLHCSSHRLSVSVWLSGPGKAVPHLSLPSQCVMIQWEWDDPPPRQRCRHGEEGGVDPGQAAESGQGDNSVQGGVEVRPVRLIFIFFSRQPPNIQHEQPVRKKEKAPPPPPTPKPNARSIARAQNPVALRYWNICRSQAQQPELHIPQSSQSVISPGDEDQHVPWALPDSPVSEPSITPARRTGSKFAIKVPNINKQIKDNPNGRTDWSTILAEDEAHQKKLRAARVSSQHSVRQNIDDSPPPKYAWMKSHANRQSGVLEGRNVGVKVKPGDLENNQVNFNWLNTMQCQVKK